MSYSAWERSVGLKRGAGRYLIEGGLPTDKTLEILRAAFGQALPATPPATDQLRQRAEAMTAARGGTDAVIAVLHSPSVRARAGASNRGRKMPPEAIARGVAARIVSGAQARALAKFRADADSPRGKVRRSLVARLRHRPHPSLDEIRQWAQLAGKRFDQEVDWVWSVWRPYLQRRGLIPRGGRPSTTADRHRVILELLANEGLTPFEPRMRWGFWKEALAEVRKVDGDRAPKNAVALRAWWAGHLASCTECDKLRPSN